MFVLPLLAELWRIPVLLEVFLFLEVALDELLDGAGVFVIAEYPILGKPEEEVA